MNDLNDRVIAAGLECLRASGVCRLVAPLTRGLGAILMFHRVRPEQRRAFAPNAGLEITPQFLDAVLTRLRALDYDILSLDGALASLREKRPSPRPFVALTFDDGYCDLVEFALPVLQHHRAPFTAYVTSGFADGSARMWWLELEEAVRRLRAVDLCVGAKRIARRCLSSQEKKAVFEEIYRAIRAGGEAQLLDVVARLSSQAGLDSRRLARDACLDWSGVRALGRHDLAEIGAHSVTHPRIATLEAAQARREMAESRARIAQETGVAPRHFCYPVGDRRSAGRREFALASQLGFVSAVTTRPGMLFAQHGDHLHALPRLSVNGRYQSLAAFETLLSGAPFALVNRGRRISA